MDHFQLKDGVLHAEDVPLPLLAQQVGTPCYVYSRATLERHARVFREGLKDAGDVHLAFAKVSPGAKRRARAPLASLAVAHDHKTRVTL